jgi:hypothetical protein
MVDVHARADAFGAAAPTTEQVWKHITQQSFAVLSYVTPSGEPRSSGVVYVAAPGRLYVAVAPDSWKARHIPATGQVAVTVPVRRGGLLSLIWPIPPATISFYARAVVHTRESLDVRSVSSQLATLVPAERLVDTRIIEIFPEGRFLTYGIGVPLLKMRTPELARAHVPVP